MKCFALDYMILVYKMSLPVRGAWVEIVPNFGSLWSTMSLPVRGAWVEMVIDYQSAGFTEVAPRAGSVG